MITLKPFAALRPQTALAASVAARPYDVLNSQEAAEEAQGNPNSFLHVTKAEINLPAGTDIHSQSVYDQAKQNLEAMIRKEALFQESKPCYYIYELVMNGRSQTGLVALSSVADYNNDLIKKHEFTRPEKEKDRIDWVWLATGDAPVDDKLMPGLSEATVLRMNAANISEWLQPAAGRQLQDHLYVVDPMGNWMMRFPPGIEIASAAQAKKDLDRLLRASSFWDTAGR